jgi:hypothetical protein
MSDSKRPLLAVSSALFGRELSFHERDLKEEIG